MLIGSQGKKTSKCEIESHEPLSANKLRPQNFFGHMYSSNSKMPTKPLSGSFGNILMPSLLGNTKL